MAKSIAVRVAAKNNAVIRRMPKHCGIRPRSIPIINITTGQLLLDELSELQELVDYRPGVMSEALAQRGNLDTYWAGLLMYNKNSHPATYRLTQIALHVAQFQAMHYKFNPGVPPNSPPNTLPLPPRPRPSQLSPSLMPPIDVPGHASYPSGHATESYLLAGMLAKIVPAAANLTDPNSAPLLRLAERVARNREVMGLHYPSDSKAGKYLGAQTLPLLLHCPSVVKLLGVAQGEWA
ncbi:MAG: phosphatase PAP2 family protein [Bradyrhizobium sp.]